MNSFKTTVHVLTISCMVNLGLLNAQDQNKDIQTAPQEVDNTPVESNRVSGTVHFNNGDSITGEIIDWDLKSLRLKSSDFLKPVTFSKDHILSIIIDDQKEDTADQSDLNKVDDLTTLILQHRNNQQGLHGIIKGGFSNIDDTHVTLNTSYAGQVKVLKKFVTKMEVDSKKGYLYLGPNSLDEWHNNSMLQSWGFNNKSLISQSDTGNIAKDIQIPESAHLSFNLSWKKEEKIDLLLYSSDPEQSTPDNYYKVLIKSSNSINIYKYRSGKKVDDMVSEKRDRRFNFAERNHNNPIKDEQNAHYEIYMSKKDGVFHIFRNGKRIDTIKDSNPKSSSFGSSIHFVSSNKSPIRLKNIKLSKWSGNLPTKVDKEAFANLKGEGQRILLKNGDILLGKVGTVKDGIMKIETLHTPIDLPIIRMRSIDLSTSDIKDEPLMYIDDIKCWFKNDGWIILKPLSINGNKLTAYHQALGENEFDLNAFKRIDLNIYEENSNTPISSDDW